MAKFEELEEVTGEVKMKQLLWDSQKEWDTSYEKWMTVRETILYTCTCVYDNYKDINSIL